MENDNYLHYSLNSIISNEEINPVKVENARRIIIELQNELSEHTKNGAGPF